MRRRPFSTGTDFLGNALILCFILLLLLLMLPAVIAARYTYRRIDRSSQKMLCWMILGCLGVIGVLILYIYANLFNNPIQLVEQFFTELFQGVFLFKLNLSHILSSLSLLWLISLCLIPALTAIIPLFLPPNRQKPATDEPTGVGSPQVEQPGYTPVGTEARERPIPQTYDMPTAHYEDIHAMSVSPLISQEQKT